jgi:RNA polymerase primary sigma factor
MKSEIDYYFDAIGRADLLTRDEEIDLFSRLNEPGVRDKIIMSNLPLVIAIAKRHWGARRLWRLIDAIQAGNVALTTAVDKHRVDRGARFSTFATLLVTQAIRAHFMQLPGYHIPPMTYRVLNRAGGTMESIDEAEQSGKIPAHAAKISRQALTALGECGAEPIDYEAPRDDTFTTVDKDDDMRQLKHAMTFLHETEKQIIDLTYREGMTLKEIGSVLGMAGERVRQTKNKAIKKLRSILSPKTTEKRHARSR